MKFTTEEGMVEGSGGVSLWWKSYTPEEPRARVCLAHGAADHSSRHLDTITHLTSLGFAVDTFDFRGHGHSGGPRGHVDRFDEYVADLRLFVGRSRARAEHRKVFILAHSQGGLVAAHLGLEKLDGVAGIMFSAPYFAFAEPPPRFKVLLGKTLGRLFPRIGVSHGMEPDRLTRDTARQAATRDDPLFVRVVTPAWLRASIPACELALRRAPDFCHPALFLLPLDDRVVDPEATRRFFDALGSADKTLVPFPGARHELMNEIVETRNSFLEQLGTWLVRHVQLPG